MKTLTILKNYAGALLLATLVGPFAYGQISFTGNYSQNFDGLVSSGNATNVFGNGTFTQYAIPSTNNSTTGWSGARIVQSGTALTSLVADTGTGNSGAIYSYGSSNSTDRALGMVASGSNTFAVGAAFTNTSNATITSLTITYTGEFWRSSTSVQNVLTFGYGFSGGNATSSNYLSDSSLNALSGLDLVGPSPIASNGVLNGNLSGNQTVFTSTINGIEWAPGTSLYIRWSDVNDAGNDAGLAIDNFNMTGRLFTGQNVPIGGSTTFSQNDFGGNLTFTNLDNAVFNSTGTTINLLGNVTADGLKFNTDGYTLTGGGSNVLTLTAGSIATPAGVSASITADLAGLTGLSKTGTGTLSLSGNNTFVGSVGVFAGRLNINSDSNLGAPTNGVVLGSATLASTGSISLGSGRSLTGSGTIETGSSQSLTVGGNLSTTTLTVNGATTVALNGASKSVGSLTITQPAAISVSGGTLAISSNLTLSGTTTLSGPLDFGGASPTLQVNGTAFTPSGAISTSNRIIKTGAGLLDLTSTTLTGNGTNAGFRFGVQGATAIEGGTIRINDTTDLGTATVLQFNSGTLDVAAPLSIASGLSIGGRTAGVASRPTLNGSPITFTGNNSFFAQAGASGDLALVVNNTTTLNGNFTATVPATNANQLVLPVTYIDLSGNGTLILNAQAAVIYDRFYINNINGAVTVVNNGNLGSDTIQVAVGTTLSGNGTFTGYHIFPVSGNATQVINEVYKSTTITVESGATLAPSGNLKFLTNLTLSPGSSTTLAITGNTSYTSLDVRLPGGNSTIASSTLTKGGSLTLNVSSPASSGNYTLITTGGNVTTSGSFGAVYLGGGYSGTLTGGTTVTSGNKTFTYSDSANVLTIGDTAPPLSALDTWRANTFAGTAAEGSTATTGTGADTADFDGDGIANLIEYATGTDAKVANTSPVTVVQSGSFLTLSYPVISDSSITYTVQGTNDLASAFTTGAGSTTGTTTKTYTDTVDLSVGGARRFLRLQVTNNALVP